MTCLKIDQSWFRVCEYPDNTKMQWPTQLRRLFQQNRSIQHSAQAEFLWRTDRDHLNVPVSQCMIELDLHGILHRRNTYRLVIWGGSSFCISNQVILACAIGPLGGMCIVLDSDASLGCTLRWWSVLGSNMKDSDSVWKLEDIVIETCGWAEYLLLSSPSIYVSILVRYSGAKKPFWAKQTPVVVSLTVTHRMELRSLLFVWFEWHRCLAQQLRSDPCRCLCFQPAQAPWDLIPKFTWCQADSEVLLTSLVVSTTEPMSDLCGGTHRPWDLNTVSTNFKVNDTRSYCYCRRKGTPLWLRCSILLCSRLSKAACRTMKRQFIVRQTQTSA